MNEWEFVELVREYIAVNQTLRNMFDRFRQGLPCFDEVAQLVGDSDESILFRLKERCHSLFRHDPGASAQIHNEVLFDLTLGSLFHEAMKLRENLYQQEVYMPRVERLLEEHGRDPGTFFVELENIQIAGADRTVDALRETEGLLSQTRDQLLALLSAHSESGLMTRNLVENAKLVEDVFGMDMASILVGIHGDAAAGYRVAAHSYLASAFFSEAVGCLDSSEEQVQPHGEVGAHAEVGRLRNYATAMLHFTAGAYAQSLESFEEWLDSEPGDDELRYLEFAESALSRFRKLVDEDASSDLLTAAESLVARIQSRLPKAEADPKADPQ
jgi:hypothetical protein